MIGHIDHVAITVSDLDETSEFYVRVLGARVARDVALNGKPSLRKIVMGGVVFNLHQADNDVTLIARRPTPGACDICLSWTGTVESAAAHLKGLGVPIVDGPSPRRTADDHPSHSVYFHDPDGNLIELMARDQA